MKMLSYCPMGPMGNAIRAVPSHSIPWDISHGIPMDKPGMLCQKHSAKNKHYNYFKKHWLIQINPRLTRKWRWRFYVEQILVTA